LILDDEEDIQKRRRVMAGLTDVDDDEDEVPLARR
jgi:hypothetical protein